MSVNGQFGKLIDQARSASEFERPVILKKLASEAAQSDPFTIGAIAKDVAHYGLSTATDFKEAVKKAASKGKRSKAPKPTDDELARLWTEAHPDTAYGAGVWRRYAAGRWPEMSLDIVRSEIRDILEATKEIGIRPTSGLLSSVLELARLDSLVCDDKWDSDHNIIVCKNGTLDISTNALRQHAPEDYATSGVPYDYDPSATCPTFQYVLDSTIPESQEFIQEYAGYCLTTDTQFETALWLYGPRGSGKSTVIEGIRAALGDQRCGLLSLYDIERSRFALTNLPGKTLVISTEQPSMFMSTTNILNALISGEPITVEKKYMNAVSFTPRAKLLWAMNDLPRVADAGDGIFRRVKVVRFPKLEDEDRDPAIKEAIKSEGAGILNWALTGLRRLRERGNFEFPESVTSATNDFQISNDVEANFLSDACTVDLTNEEEKTQSSELYGAYSAWCKSNGHKAKSSTKIAEDWKRLGLVKYAREGKMYWRFVKVNW